MTEQRSTEKVGENVTRKASKSTPFIIINIFLERYCTAGILGKEIKKNDMKIHKHFINDDFFSNTSIIST